ncbi:hypothetical protein Nepgr_001061 [Nepenthes gracilis]|uniref:Uncharacterized protein n=1 Tax=Nepenthes gracilis TaxID=150966 RepID=A0AAD3RVU4_NEPGR|nr:hypothetical protein Nepgr_001061 [Nepenthes gracilis]
MDSVNFAAVDSCCFQIYCRSCNDVGTAFVVLLNMMQALRPFFALLEMENATHGMEDSLPVLVLLRRIEMALYATLSGLLIQPEVKC